MNRSKSFVATPPGATIKEQLVERGMRQKEFAARMEMSEKHISKLINGEVQLTPDMAVRLEMVLGVPAQFWSNLEAIYRDKLIRARNENEMDADVELVKELPYSLMAKNGWVPETRKAQERVVNTRKFFEVVNLELVKDPRLNRIAFQKNSESEKEDLAFLAWAQRAKLEARQIETEPINIKLLKERIPAIRKMTERTPDEFCPELVRFLSECGIALVFLPHIGGDFLHGATFYDGDKIVIGLTVSGKYADMFWFSLFHELAHIIYGHIGQTDGTSEKDEIDADSYARDILIPEEDYDILIEKHDFSKDSIKRFAAYVGINAGIVVGRLQHEGYIEYSGYNDLNMKYVVSV